MTNRIDSTWSDGEILYAADLNDTFSPIDTITRPVSIYTGTAFNSSISTTGSNSNNHTLTISAGLINSIVLIKVILSFDSNIQCSNPGSATNTLSLKFETSEASAASWTTRFDEIILYNWAQTNEIYVNSSPKVIEFYYTPTAGEKTNGLDVRITSSIVGALLTGSINTQSANITNIQTILFYN